MTRTLKNINEFILLASISCGAAFLARVYPVISLPLLIFRVSILAFISYLLCLEGRREIAVVIGGAILCGWILGYNDFFQLLWQYKQGEIIFGFCAVALLMLCAAFSPVVKRLIENVKTR